MENARDFKDIEDYAAACIRHKVRQLITRLGFEASEREDMEQELSLHLYQNLPSYDPDRGSIKTFIARVLDNKIRTMVLVKFRRDAHMNNTPAVSLNVTFTDEDGCTCERIDALTSENDLFGGGAESLTALDRCDMRMDIERVVAGLPQPLRDICECLQQTQSVARLSAATGKSRQQVYYAIGKLKRIFKDAGFADFL